MQWGDAEEAGFAVGEDFSVDDIRATVNPAELIARQSQAQAFAADIRQRAITLTEVDNDVAGSLTAITGNVGDALFTGAAGRLARKREIARFGTTQVPSLPASLGTGRPAAGLAGVNCAACGW